MISCFVEESASLTRSTTFLNFRKESSLRAWNALNAIKEWLSSRTYIDLIVLGEFLVIVVDVIQVFIVRNDQWTLSGINVRDSDFGHVACVSFCIVLIASLTLLTLFSLNIKKFFALNTFRSCIKWSVLWTSYSVWWDFVLVIIKRLANWYNDMISSWWWNASSRAFIIFALVFFFIEIVTSETFRSS